MLVIRLSVSVFWKPWTLNLEPVNGYLFLTFTESLFTAMVFTVLLSGWVLFYRLRPLKNSRVNKEQFLVAEQKPPPTFGIIRQRIFGIPVDRKILFSNHNNIYKKKIEKRQRKLIVKIPFIKAFIKENERVLLITTGYSPISTIEKYLIGWLFIYLKRSLFVFTNKRLFHIPTTPNYSYRNSKETMWNYDLFKI